MKLRLPLHLGRFLALASIMILTTAVSDAAELSDRGTFEAYRSADGETFFALPVRAEGLTADAAPRNHVVMVDTSASQVGEHRRQSLAVLEAFLTNLPAEDRVALYSVDVSSQRLTAGMVGPQSSEMEAGLEQLRRRVPLGATDLLTGLKGALNVVGKDRPGSIIYIGDGMSTAQLIQSKDMQELLAELRAAQVPVHSYAVGPKTDLELLGVLAQYTGGTVSIDVADSKSADPQTIGSELASAVQQPVYYPSSLDVRTDGVTVLPNVALPLRTDRDTIYLAQSSFFGHVEIQLTGQVDGQNVTVKQQVMNDQLQNGHVYLRAMFHRAKQNGGLTNSLAGENLLRAAQNSFDLHIEQLVDLGEEAVATRRNADALEIGRLIQQLDPDNVQGKTILGAVEKVQERIVLAQAQPGPADDSLLDDPNAVPEELEDREAPPTGPAADLIEGEINRRKVLGEQLSMEVARVIAEARRVLADDAESARSELKRALGQVGATTDIDPLVKSTLIKRLESTLLDVDAQIERNQQMQALAQERLAQLAAEQRLLDKLQLEEEELEILIDQVRGLMVEGWHGDDTAFEKAESVARIAVDIRPGNGPATAALFNAEAAGQLNKAFRMRSLRADRFLETLYQVELSHVPFPDEPPIRWPPAEVWVALSERRQKWASVDLHSSSPSEQRIQESLGETTEIEFIDTPLSEAMEFISDLHDIPIILEIAALEEDGILPDEPINLQLSGITLRSALKIMLEPIGATYIIEDEVMKITTELAAEDKLSTRVYPVGDLVIPITSPMAAGLGQGLGGAGGFGGQGGTGGGQFGAGSQSFGGGSGGGVGGGFYYVPPESVPDNPAANDSDFRFDNEAIESLKKKETLNR